MKSNDRFSKNQTKVRIINDHYSVGILVFGGDHYRNLSHIVDPIGYEIMHLVNYPVETAGSDFWGSCAGELNTSLMSHHYSLIYIK